MLEILKKLPIFFALISGKPLTATDTATGKTYVITYSQKSKKFEYYLDMDSKEDFKVEFVSIAKPK